MPICRYDPMALNAFIKIVGPDRLLLCADLAQSSQSLHCNSLSAYGQERTLVEF